MNEAVDAYHTRYTAEGERPDLLTNREIALGEGVFALLSIAPVLIREDVVLGRALGNRTYIPDAIDLGYQARMSTLTDWNKHK